jgi:hypothetical protein
MVFKPEPPHVPVKTSKTKKLPCIATTLSKNGEILYLLDSSNNLVFCNEDGLISLNVDKIQNNFNNKTKPDNLDKFYTTSFKNDCVSKVITLETKDRLLEEPDNNNVDKFLLNEIRINGDILTKYNLTDISLNKFEASRLFRETYLKDSSEYKKLNNNDKKRYACGLYYYFITEKVIFLDSLITYLEEEKKKVERKYIEGDSIKRFYLDNNRNINKWQIHKLTDFQTVFIIQVKKKEELKQGGGGISSGYIALIVFFVVLIVAGGLIYKYRNNIMNFFSKKMTSVAPAVATAPVVATAPASVHTPTPAPAPVPAPVPAPAHAAAPAHKLTVTSVPAAAPAHKLTVTSVPAAAPAHKLTVTSVPAHTSFAAPVHKLTVSSVPAPSHGTRFGIGYA